MKSMSQSEREDNWSEGHFSSHDGLNLFARHYRASGDPGRPVLCLPGLTRNSKDFHVLATHLSAHAERSRNVYCLDYRGRGQSDYDPTSENYTPYIELLDVLNFMTITGLHGAAVIGTSRGGIIAMLMAVMRPTAVSVCVLNDIGPVIETGGLARIVGYVGRTPIPANWQEAGEIARRMNEQFFPDVSDDEWEAVARQWFSETDGNLRPDYDTKLAEAMEEIDLTKKIPEMWPQYRALGRAPTLILRGEHSDLLSDGTAKKMLEDHPAATLHTVPDQGHAPFSARYGHSGNNRRFSGND